jgi:asparagine synthase (glutamine-hydrolysing)
LVRLGVPRRRLDEVEARAHRPPAAVYSDAMRVFARSAAERLLHADRRAAAAAALAEDPLVTLYDRADAVEWLDRLLYTDLTSYLAENVLVKVDRMTMAHGIEARSPLCDHRLVELAARLPSRWKRAPSGTGKLLLREVAAGVLPAAALGGPKRGFNMPVHAWMRTGPLRRTLDGLLADSRLVADGWLDGGALAAEAAPGRDGAAPLGNRLWSIYVLELWYRQMAGRPRQVSMTSQGS